MVCICDTDLTGMLAALGLDASVAVLVLRARVGFENSLKLHTMVLVKK